MSLLRITVEHDDDARSPREDGCNADVLYCKHSRYTLGDKDAESPTYEAAFVTLTSPTGTEYVLDDSNNDYECNLTYDDVEAMLEAHAEDAAADAMELNISNDAQVAAERDAMRAADGYEYVRKATWESEHRLKADIAMCRELYLHDHSGITISASPFGCRWDSGQVGFQYVTKDSLATEWNGDEAKALSYMDAVLETYDEYIQGNVYGYVIETGRQTFYEDGTEADVDWEETDSCWGFYGYDPKENGMQDHVPDELHEALAKAADDIGVAYEQ